jgi:hypothetical protein
MAPWAGWCMALAQALAARRPPQQPLNDRKMCWDGWEGITVENSY